MKKYITLALSVILLILLLSPTASADRTEKVKVIKFDKDKNDLIVEQGNGQRWLIQHNRSCTSMTQDFPVELIWVDGKITELKVDFTEQCAVYNAVPYGGDGSLVQLFTSKNLLVPDHEAEIIMKNKKYLIDYKGKGCKYLYDFVGKKIYYSFPPYTFSKGDIVLPGNRGTCPFTTEETLEVIEKPVDPDMPGAIRNLDYQAQNNKVYFYWEPPEQEGIYLYVISFSKYPLNLDDYSSWKEMPNIRYTRDTSFYVRRLANGQKYYFYLTALKEGKTEGPWLSAEATPVAPVMTYKKNSDDIKFQVNMEEREDSFRLYWPDMENARRYFVRLYVNGKEEFFKILRTDKTEYIIPKSDYYLGDGLRFTVRVVPNRPFGNAPRDGVYWKYLGD